jgi:uncharacterized membrane protein (DUF485 family)
MKKKKKIYSIIALIIFSILIVLFKFGTPLINKLNNLTTIIIAIILLVIIIIIDICTKNKKNNIFDKYN